MNASAGSNKGMCSRQLAATAALLLLLSDHRFFFTSFGVALDNFESLPGLGSDCTWDNTTSFGCVRLASSKSVGRPVAIDNGEGGLATIVAVASDLIVSSSVNLVILDTLRAFFGRNSAVARGAIAGAFPSRVTGEASSSLETCTTAAPASTFRAVGTGFAARNVAARDALDAIGTMVTELAEEPAVEDTAEVVTAVPNCMGGSAGTGGIPAARKLVRWAYKFRGGTAEWFGSETRREWPGCSRWTVSMSLVGRGLTPLIGGGMEAQCLVGFISRSSWELFELLELSTGETATSPFLRVSPIGRGVRPIDALLDDRLVCDDTPMILSTSLPFRDMWPMSTGL